jgi:two-component system chemotaxis response regulator CheB
MTKLLIVDDSALMRRQLTNLFEAEAGYELQQARNGKEAVEMNVSFMPDVVVLDINMPEMDGITALSLMMAERPVPVVMLSSLTAKGALVTFEALALGAVDYVAKPGGTISLSLEVIKEELLSKIKAATKAKLNKKPTQNSPVSKRNTSTEHEIDRPVPRKLTASGGTKSPTVTKSITSRLSAETDLVIIGVSTGGPKTLEEILPFLPANFPCPIVIAQHMPAGFTLSFANRLNQSCPMRVTELDKMMPLEAGCIYISKGGSDVTVTYRNGQLMGMIKPESAEHLWHPSVELLGRSVLKACDVQKVVAVMLTGMGNDGSQAFADIKKQGGRVIAESEASAIVFGMPGELIKLSGANLVLSADKIAQQLIAWVR